jgi:hypothetical protein
MLPFCCAALSACSLINSYEDVKGSGGSGASGAGDPSGGSGGEPPVGGGPVGGEGTGGAGGTPQILVTCEVAGDPFQVEDLSGAPMGQRTYDGSSFGYQPNGDRVRVFLRVQQEMKGIEIDVDDQVINDSFTLQAQELMWARPVGPSTFGLLVASPQVGVGYPLDLLVWPNNGSLQDPDIYAISAGPLTSVSTNTPRGLFVHAGNEPDNIGLLLRSFEGGMHRLRYARHLPSSLVETSATIGAPASDEEEVSPRALVRTSDAMMHAFFGSPSMGGTGGTKQWVFPENAATITGQPTEIGPPGAILIDASRKGDATVNVAAGQISPTDLRLKGDNVTEAELSSIDTNDFNTLIELNSFLDVPNTGEAQILSDAVLLGANSTKDKIVMIVGGLSGGAAIYNTDLLVPSDTADAFSDVAVFVTNSPISALGGIGRLIYSERHDTGPNAYDALMVATIACEQRQ